MFHFLWRADTPGSSGTIVTFLLWHILPAALVLFYRHFAVSGDVQSLLNLLHCILLIYSVKLGLRVVVIVQAGACNQLNFVQAVLQDNQMKSSLLSDHINTGGTRWRKYAVCSVLCV